MGKGAKGQGPRPKGATGRQEAPTGGTGNAPDIDGLVLYLLLSGRDALAMSRGPHWQQGITEEALGPVAGNLAEALRRAFPELARTAESKSPLIAGIMGLGLLIAPVIAYERMVQNAQQTAQSSDPTPNV